jgi:hypothetical protein
VIVGDPRTFAIESSITRAYEQLSLRALGFFVLHVGGRCYGKRTSDATMLACSYDEVESRIAGRGGHVAPFASAPNTGLIANAVRESLYAAEPEPAYFDIPAEEFREIIYSRRILWAPDGDEAFDDGSHVLQFDVGGQVRLVAFKAGAGSEHDPNTLRDTWLTADRFYRTLQDWHDAFEAERMSMPQIRT